MNDGPICDRCKQPILPGQNVTPLGKSVEELMEERIFVADALILVHADPAECIREEGQ
jgi:hypothetical protein